MRTITALAATLWLILPGATMAADEPFLMNLWLPDNDWAFQIDLTGFRITAQHISPESTGRTLAAEDDAQRVNFSVTLEPNERNWTAVRVRDEYVKHLEKDLAKQFKMIGLKSQNVKTFEQRDAAFVTFDVVADTGASGFRTLQVYAFLVMNSTRITVNASCLGNEPWDTTAYNRLFGSLAFIAPYQPTVYDYFAFGSQHYTNRDWKTTIDLYEKALALEKQDRVLKRQYWLVLVDNLGMAYGLSGDPAHAREIFNLGLSLEPEYPMFHYNLACAFAEGKQLDSALVHLARAFEFEANMIPGEVLPDPAQDESFKRYWKDEKFRQLLAGMPKK